ncbi:TrbC/VirB2 family protein [Luteibacter sp. Lutesp34]|uniref:TrbC/VirB2 family protein n=1 Tax=Luteibacter sp. Lutesp34 TaxID=3243030 RepID=UPI0039B604ED
MQTLVNRFVLNHWTLGIAICLLLIATPELAQAYEMPGGGGLPYESGLKSLRESMRGPVPFVISLAGIVGCGAMLIFGGEISGFMRTMVFIVLVVAVILQAENLMGMLQTPTNRSVVGTEASTVDALGQS